MSSLYQTALHLLDVTAVVAFVAVLLITRRNGYRFEIRGVGLFFAVWAAVFLVEYWALGPYSHVSMDEEGDISYTRISTDDWQQMELPQSADVQEPAGVARQSVVIFSTGNGAGPQGKR